MKRYGRFHGSQAEELHHVVRNHVAQCARVVEISAALFHADGFRIRDLHMVYVTSVPYGLEDGIVEAEDHYVLYGLFTEVVIDAVNLILGQHALDLTVQGLGRLEIVSERLLDHHPPPAFIFLVTQANRSQLLDNLREKLGGRGQVKQIIPFGIVFPVGIAEPILEYGICGWISKVPALVVEPLGEPLPSVSPVIFSLQKLGRLIAELLQAQFVVRDAQNREIRRKQFRFDQVLKRRN